MTNHVGKFIVCACANMRERPISLNVNKHFVRLTFVVCHDPQKYLNTKIICAKKIQYHKFVRYAQFLLNLT